MYNTCKGKIGRSDGYGIKKLFSRETKSVKSSPITGLDRPRGFQEVKVPRFHDNGTGWW